MGHKIQRTVSKHCKYIIIISCCIVPTSARQWMRQVVGFGDRSTGGGNFGDECGSPLSNQWGVCGVVAPFQITLGFLVP